MDKELSLKIEKRAYELFLARNGAHGYHLEDWVKAEKEILGIARQAGAPATPPKAAASRVKKAR